jgi:two-component system NarL family sensor kinase
VTAGTHSGHYVSVQHEWSSTRGGAAADNRSRLGLGIASAVLVMVVTALGFEFRLSELGTTFVERFNVLRAASALGFGLPGAFVVAVRPRNRIGWLLAAVGVAQAVSLLGSNYGLAGIHDPTGSLPGDGWAMWVSEGIWSPAYFLVPTLLLLVFPTGRLPSPRWWPVAVVAVLAAGLSAVGWALLPPAQNDVNGLFPPGYRGPVPSSPGIADAALSTSLLLGVVAIVASLASLAKRYRRATGAQRQQLKWVLLGALAHVVLGLAGFFTPAPLGPLVAGIAVVPLPVTMAIAVIQHRLWDIDVILSRSLVFGTLTVGVLAVYGITVVVVGGLLGASTGAPLVATALVAVAIDPAHRRVRGLVNRLVYGDRDDPVSALRHLGARLGAAGNLGDVLTDVTQAISRRLRVPYVAVEEAGVPTGVWGEPVPALERVPLSHRGTDVGTLVVGTAAGDRLRSADRRALLELAPHVAVVAHASSLARDLKRSHERLFAARDDERRRLRRELHDGLGPTLAALALEIDRGRLLVRSDPDGADRLLDRLSSQVRDAVAGVRAIVDDLHPPPLDDLGLISAVEDLAGRFSGKLTVTVEAEALPPLPAAVELAAYRIAAEAITNAARHSCASRCGVTLAAGRELELRVVDDGRGLPCDISDGMGLRSMRQRAADLGGCCTVARRPGGGTQVAARLPLKQRAGDEVEG